MTPAVVRASDIQPERSADGAGIRTMLDISGVAGRLVRRLVDIPPGASFAGTGGPGGELWFVISGRCELEPGPAGATQSARADRHQGLRLPAGAGYRLRASGPEPVQLDAVALPAPGQAPAPRPGQAPAPGQAPGPLVADLRDCVVQATGDRRFRVLFGPGLGCAEATQFVGEIPPGRAPDHSHAYDEVVLVLAGAGVLHAGGADQPLAPGSCVHLPPGQQHCLENTGQALLVVLGVFHPGGSPAAKVQDGKVQDGREQDGREQDAGEPR